MSIMQDPIPGTKEAINALKTEAERVRGLEQAKLETRRSALLRSHGPYHWWLLTLRLFRGKRLENRIRLLQSDIDACQGALSSLDHQDYTPAINVLEKVLLPKLRRIAKEEPIETFMFGTGQKVAQVELLIKGLRSLQQQSS